MAKHQWPAANQDFSGECFAGYEDAGVLFRDVGRWVRRNAIQVESVQFYYHPDGEWCMTVFHEADYTSAG